MGLLEFLTKNQGSVSSAPIAFPNRLPTGELLYKEYHYILIDTLPAKELDLSKVKIGDDLSFIQEPFNKKDPETVAIYDGYIKIGYVVRGIGQNMTNDFLNQGKPILAKITFIDLQSRTLKIDMGYYYKRKKSK